MREHTHTHTQKGGECTKEKKEKKSLYWKTTQIGAKNAYEQIVCNINFMKLYRIVIKT
jgi:hypothetical protein